MNKDKLLQAVLRHSGMKRSELADVCRGGADAGFPGFTYTYDAVRFYNRHEGEIYELLQETADDMGSKNIEELITGFKCSDMCDTADGRKNLLAWFALEEMARYAHPNE